MYMYAEVMAGLLTQQPLKYVTYLTSRIVILQTVYCVGSFVYKTGIDLVVLCAAPISKMQCGCIIIQWIRIIACSII